MTQKNSLIHERTPIIPAAAENYLFDEPHYRKCGLAMGVNTYAKMLLGRTDTFEFWLRRYIGGRARTLHRVNYEVRDFLFFDERSARGMIAFSLDAVQYTLLTNEWYELMGRYQTARQRIQKKFGIEDIPQATWQLLGFKPEFL